MVLSAFLKLDASGFLSPMGKVTEGMKFMTRTLENFSAKISEGFNFGANMDNLSTQLGISAGRVTVLRQAFDDAGIGGESLAQTMNAMRKALGGVSEDGEPTNKMFKQLGLSVDALKGMDAEGQFTTIGAAIKNIADPLERANALTAVFGKSGSPLARIFADDGAIEAAEKRLGGLPAIMDKNAAAFNQISTRIGALKTKTTGFWAGMAEGVMPMADSLTKAFDGIDLTGLGQKIGTSVSSYVQMFREAPFGQVMADSVGAAGEQLFNWLGEGFKTVGSWITKDFGDSINIVGPFFEGLFDFISKALKTSFEIGWSGFKIAGGEAINWGLTGIFKLSEWMTEKFGEAWDKINADGKGWFATMKDDIKNQAKFWFDSMMSYAKIFYGSLASLLGRIANATAGIFGKKLFDLEGLHEYLGKELESTWVGKGIVGMAEGFETGLTNYAETGKATVFDMGDEKKKLQNLVGEQFKLIGDTLGGFFDGSTKRFVERFDMAKLNILGEQDAIATGAVNANPWGNLNLAPPEAQKKKESGGGGNDFLSDALARIGGMVGGTMGGGSRRMETIAERTARNTEELVRLAGRGNINSMGGPQGIAVFA